MTQPKDAFIPPKETFRLTSHVKSQEDYRRLYKKSLEQPEAFWGEMAQQLTWFHKPAIIWAKNEPGEYQVISFRDLQHHVGRVANVLKAHGVRKGDRVCIYLPMVPELAYTMLACARIGAVHSVVFAGFSAESLRERILDSGAKVLVTANEGPRGPKLVPTKAIADEAVEGLSLVESILVVRRTSKEVPMRADRDFWLDVEMSKHRGVCPAEWMDSEDPLFILYTSGSTGKPKGVLHTTGGYLTYAATTFRYVFDIQPTDVHFCAADLGWVTGHSYILYGPLATGTTTVMFESTPTYPDAGRLWQVVDDLKATILYTAPTALRALIKEGDGFVKKSSRKTLRLLGSVGEPINPEVWRWYHDVVGEGRCPVVDTWWQTETGGILIAPLPGASPCKPGSATLPFFGVEPVLVDDEDVSGHRLGTAEVESALVAHESVAEAAVVGFPHDLKGTGVCAFVTMKPDWADASSEQMVGALKEQVRHVIGPIATPDRVVLVNGLPKTRSGKILRRMPRKIASGETENLGDATTLADPGVLDELLAKGMPPQVKR